MLAESNDTNRNSITDGMYILLNQHAAKSQLLSTYSRVLLLQPLFSLPHYLISSPALYDRFSSFINLSCLQVVHLPLHFFILSVVVFETRSNGLIFSPHLHLHYLRGVFPIL
jgi:hypothetical protein